MGWKNFKEHFHILHPVQVNKNGLCIGSAYISELACINLKTGAITKNGVFSDFLKEHYPKILETSADEIVALLQSEDTFKESITVYTYNDAEIIEKLCETPCWPNLTHDGAIMYENSFSTDKAKVVEWAKNSSNYRVKWLTEKVESLKADLAKYNSDLKKAEHDLSELQTML